MSRPARPAAGSRRRRRSAGGAGAGRADRDRAGVAAGLRQGRRRPISRACSTPGRTSPSRRPRPRRCSRPASPKRCGSRSEPRSRRRSARPGKMVSDVSLLAADLMRGGPAPAAAAAPPAPSAAAAPHRAAQRPAPAPRRRPHRLRRPRRRRAEAPATRRRVTDSSAGKPRPRKFDRATAGNSFVTKLRSSAVAGARRCVAAGLGRRAAPAAIARAAHRAARKAGPAGPAAGLSQGPPGRHRGLRRRAGGDPVVGRDARPAARFARAADDRPRPP